MFCLQSIDLIRIGIIAYVGLWLVMAMRLHLYCRRGKKINVHRAFRLYYYSCFSRHIGWLLGLLVIVILMYMLPKVYIVTQDIPRCMAIIKEDNLKYDWYTRDTISTAREAFFADERYVLFRYGKNKCQAGATYLMNDTDSTLALYSTTQFNGIFTKADDAHSLIEIKPNQFLRIDKPINNIFNSPTESTGYVPKKYRNKSVTEWTLALLHDAIDNITSIRNKIYYIPLSQNTDTSSEPYDIPSYILAPTIDPKTKKIISPTLKETQTEDDATADDSK